MNINFMQMEDIQNAVNGSCLSESITVRFLQFLPRQEAPHYRDVAPKPKSEPD